jgi:hypothetical protein
MDPSRFDQLARGLGTTPSRRGLVGALLGVVPALLGLGETQAATSCPANRRCGAGKCCPKGGVCCNPNRKRCCGRTAECCNPGPRGTCCARPNRCAKPWGNDAAPWTCCPKKRQWTTGTGRLRCCPAGTRSLGTGISSDDGPCCPEAKYCSQAPTGGKCCPDAAPVCVNKATGQCCTEADRCGTECCGFGRPCCNGKCCPFGQTCDGGTCKCQPGVRQCGDTCCGPSAVACEGSTCLNQCDIDGDCGG